MTCLLDVNFLMALLLENHEHHAKTRSWFKGVSDFATCPVVSFLSPMSCPRASSRAALGVTPSA